MRRILFLLLFINSIACAGVIWTTDPAFKDSTNAYIDWNGIPHGIELQMPLTVPIHGSPGSTAEMQPRAPGIAVAGDGWFIAYVSPWMVFRDPVYAVGAWMQSAHDDLDCCQFITGMEIYGTSDNFLSSLWVEGQASFDGEFYNTPRLFFGAKSTDAIGKVLFLSGTTSASAPLPRFPFTWIEIETVYLQIDIPEPATVVLVGAGFLALVLFRRRLAVEADKANPNTSPRSDGCSV